MSPSRLLRQGRLSLAAAAVVLGLVACSAEQTNDPEQPAEEVSHPVPDHAAPQPLEESLAAPERVPGVRPLELSWEEECRWLGHDVQRPDEQEPEALELHLQVGADALQALYERDPWSDERVPAEYRIGPDGPFEPLREPGLRFRGNSSRAHPKKSFNLRFDEVVPELGVDRVNLNAMYTDPSLVREHLAFRMLAEAGVPTPRTRYIRLYVNDVYEGLYLFVQRIDETLLDEHGLRSDVGTLVRDRARDRFEGNVSVFSVQELPYDDRTALRAELSQTFDSRGTPDWDLLVDLVLAVEQREGPVEFAQLDELLDVDAIIDWYAAHVLVGDVDAYTDDYWLYHGGGPEDRWVLLPWDKDLSFGTHYVPGHGTANHLFHYEWPLYERATPRNGLLAMVFEVPEVRHRFEQRLLELSTIFDSHYLCDRLAAVAPVVASRELTSSESFELHGAEHFGSPDDHAAYLARVVDYHQLRQAFLERRIGDVPGQANTASSKLSESDVGRSVLFVDGEGWTVARLDVLEVMASGELTVEVVHDHRWPEVDRRWVVEGDAMVRGQLSLYYRNTEEFGNWYRSEQEPLEPIGGQGDLRIASLVGDAPEAYPSAANPLSNRVTAEVVLEAGASFVLVEGAG